MGLGGSERGGRKNKPTRGGARHFTPARVLREDGDVWNQVREKPESENDSSEASSSDEEDSSSDERTTATQPKIVPAGAGNAKLGNTVESDSEETAAPKGKSKSAAAGGADIVNANRPTKAHLKASELTGERELSRREREALAKEKAKAAFWKAQEEGKTDQARADLARLAIIKKQREEAARKKAEEAAMKGKPVGAKAESLNAGKGIIGKTIGSKR
ncbi:casein kinase substrate phosphoprotein PP28-domain-containing protein [Geranomyces variabilis]|nr:casein kinase substrate phosphoprotein PP28-domain-containing protein [Geranomyces variabilis]KAJ3131850.1 heat- and acid-stable phosphoprotein [Geranomyces variabilis]